MNIADKVDRIGYIDTKTGQELTKEMVKAIELEYKARRSKELDSKFEKGIISKLELEELMRYKYKNGTTSINYRSFFKVNMCKPKPEGVTHAEYGKFFQMLNFLSYENTIAHGNGKVVKKEDLSEFLGFKNIRGFGIYIKKLVGVGMVGLSDIKNSEFLFINPAYAQRNMRLDSTIFNLFRDDLIEFLDMYQLKYFSMHDEDEEISSVIKFI